MPPLSLGTSAEHSQSKRADHASAALFPYAQPRAAAAAGARVGSPCGIPASSRATEDRGGDGNLPRSLRPGQRDTRCRALPAASRRSCRGSGSLSVALDEAEAYAAAETSHEADNLVLEKELTSLNVVAPGRPRMSAGRRRPTPRGLQPAARTPPPTRPHRRRGLPRPAPRSGRSGYR